MNLSLHSYLDMILNINDLLQYGFKKGYKKNPIYCAKVFSHPSFVVLSNHFVDFLF